MARRTIRDIPGQETFFEIPTPPPYAPPDHVWPHSDWRPPDLAQLPEWRRAKRIAIDVETYDPLLKIVGPSVRHGGYIVGVAFALEDGPSFYLPYRHQCAVDNLPADQVLRYVREQVASLETTTIVGANLAYDLDFLAVEGVVFPDTVWFRDVQIAEPLLDELQASYSLQNIATRYGLPGKDEHLLDAAAHLWRTSSKGGLWQLPARFVGPYAQRDVELPLILLRRQERQLEDEGLWPVYNLESRLLPILVAMRRHGVRIDTDRLDQIADWALREATECVREVSFHSGIKVAVTDLWKAGALARALQTVGLAIPKTALGHPSITHEWLEQQTHPVARAVSRARLVDKIRTTFCESIRTHLVDHGPGNQRIHCTFNQLRRQREDDSLGGGRYGRLSSEHPNMQQQPSRGVFTQGQALSVLGKSPGDVVQLGKLWRSIYVPDEGGLWATLDYSAQEPRMVCHYAARMQLPGADFLVERYRQETQTDEMDIHRAMAELLGWVTPTMSKAEAKPQRDRAKNIFLGLCYGMGPAKLCRAIGYPTQWVTARDGRLIETAGPEGQQILDRFDQMVPFVRQLAKRCSLVASERGFIRTLDGRRCRFPQLPDGTFDWCHKALNRLIQGSSAGQTKAAMVAAWDAGFNLQLQVHDELDLTVYSLGEAEALAQIMRTCTPLEVPSRIDLEIGPNWGEVASPYS